ncbi:hypothetical protein [Burkholderia multivorans]|uniref:hypothetical protein n=1 Tax=Burkholderia multivorans TaxID=87883 RepID=UPI001C22981B|nr:hypothetical protein [Burkholderia multivorans]MBU9164874.1 hypothetical protein [Burkholderia multivorans]
MPPRSARVESDARFHPFSTPPQQPNTAMRSRSTLQDGMPFNAFGHQFRNQASAVDIVSMSIKLREAADKRRCSA